MEEYINFKSEDGKTIYGTLTKPVSSQPHVVIFSHGFSGHQNEHIFFNGARFFMKHNFSSFRFDYYSDNDGAREMKDADMDTHRMDLRAVTARFKNDFKKIFFVGHSIGAQVIVRENPKEAAALALWDPSREPKDLVADLEYLPDISSYVMRWNTEFLVSERMAENYKAQPPIPEVMEKVETPVKIIAAGKAYGEKAEELYFDSNLEKQNREFVSVEGANHTFDAWGTEEKLFEETYVWFKKFLDSQ
ncbi:MAG: hypothetical protein Q8P52_02520 [bacterium]|nr:hypothetical protein [bacterium]